ncbi:MAG: sigma 54-interacting transcriptional regulator [Planctomycetaceae bacterium]|nr:sigma 54-interacting transcriptional regulator [Planctomycetaceae bacterium]
MQHYHALLIDVWREVCQHIEIDEAVSLIARLLTRKLPLATILVRRIDLQRGSVETIAGPAPAWGEEALEQRTDLDPAALQAALAWCRRGEVWHRRSTERPRPPRGLLPEPLQAEAVVGPLNMSDGSAGVLILVPRAEEPFDAEHARLAEVLLEPFTVAVENDRRLRELIALREAAEADKRSLLSRLGRNDISDTIVGAETGLRPILERVELVARTEVPVLLLGETGSGKEVVARAVHNRSRRAAGPFLRVNCGAISPELVDSELFGHERGSFTGAVGTRKGWFERADGGTLLLDECGELPPAVQVRLLRILQDGSFERVGGERQLHCDVRVIAATHRDLPAMISSGNFREDLWYRLAVFPIRLPPLRERHEDIPAMAANFAHRAAQRLGLPPCTPNSEDIRLLAAYSWPGNVRELAAVIERAAILGDGRTLEVAKALGTAPPPRPARPAPTRPTVTAGDVELPTLDEAMARHIEAALAAARGQVEGDDGAARILGINPHTLRARMRKLGIAWQRFRPGVRPRAGRSASPADLLRQLPSDTSPSVDS